MKSIDDWKPEVGMEVYIHPTYHNRSKARTVKITKVGRTLFYVSYGFPELKFYISTKDENAGQYSSSWHCYRSKSDHDRSEALKEKRLFVEKYVHKLTDEQVDTVFGWITNNP